MNEENIQKTIDIYKTVKLYNYNPQYTLHLSAFGFSFEVLVNDFPVHIKYETGAVTGSVPINEALLKSGIQTLKVRMTPPVDKEFNMGTEIDFSVSRLKLSINYGEYGKQKVKDFPYVLEYVMPDSDQILPYYEVT